MPRERTGAGARLARPRLCPARSVPRRRILSGEIASKLPPLTELTGETHLAVGTVRRAIDVLARERLVQRVPGRGTFVTNSDSTRTRGADRYL